MGQQPGGGQQDKEIIFTQQPGKTTQGDKAEQGDDDQAGNQAKLLARHGKYEICVGIGQDPFDHTLARSPAQKTTLAKGIHGAINLIGIAAGRIQKAVDTAGYMGNGGVGNDRTDQPQAGQGADPYH